MADKIEMCYNTLTSTCERSSFIGGITLITPEEYGLEIAKAAAAEVGKQSVDKIANAISGLFPFWGIKKRAIDTYVSEITDSDLSPETKLVAIASAKNTYKQLKNQNDIVQIALDSAKDGTDFSRDSNVDEEWLDRFMDSAKFVSDEQMKLIWGNVLAREFEQPNSTPPSVVRILSEITPTYANVFQTLCSLRILFWKDGILSPIKSQIILPDKHEYLDKYNITFATLSELEMLGLIQYSSALHFITKFSAQQIPKLRLSYGIETATVIKFPDKQFPIGSVLLTAAGEAIARCTEQQIIDGHFSEVIEYMKSNNVKFEEGASS